MEQGALRKFQTGPLRPMAWTVGGFLGALFLCLFFAAGEIRLPLLLAGGCFLLWGPLRLLCRRRAAFRWFLLPLLGLLLGFLWRSGWSALVVRPAEALAGEEVTLTVEVLEAGEYGYIGRGKIGGRSLRLWVSSYQEEELLPGSRYRITGVISLPAKGGSFDKARYYNAEGIFVLITPSSEEALPARTSLRGILASLRQKSGKILDSLYGSVVGEMRALLLGEKSALPEKTADALSRAGLSHAFVVSGMHLAFLLSLVAYFRPKRGYLLLAALLGGFFCLFTGLGPSVLRAFLMLFYSSIALKACLPRDTVTGLLTSLALLLAVNPFLGENAGLIFSYLAVIGIYAITPLLRSLFIFPTLLLGDSLSGKLWVRLTGAFSVTLGAFLATLPAVVCYYGYFGRGCLLGGIFFLWMVEPLFIGGMLSLSIGALFLPAGRLMAQPVRWLLQLFLSGIQNLQELSGAPRGLDSTGGGAILVGVVLAILLVMVLIFRGLGLRLFAPFPCALAGWLLLSACLFLSPTLRGESLSLTVLPTKEECILLSSGNFHALIGWEEEAEELLLRRGITGVDLLFWPEEEDALPEEAAAVADRVICGESRLLTVSEGGGIQILTTPEGNLTVYCGGYQISVLFSPAPDRESDLVFLGREASKSDNTEKLVTGKNIYVLGKPSTAWKLSLSPEDSALWYAGETTFRITRRGLVTGSLLFPRILSEGS